MEEEFIYCSACLATDVKMFSFDKSTSTKNATLAVLYEHLVQTPKEIFATNPHVCYECANFLQKYQEFKSKCLFAQNVLVSIDKTKPTKQDLIINKKKYRMKSSFNYSSILALDVVNNIIAQYDINIDTDDIEPDNIISDMLLAEDIKEEHLSDIDITEHEIGGVNYSIDDHVVATKSESPKNIVRPKLNQKDYALSTSTSLKDPPQRIMLKLLPKPKRERDILIVPKRFLAKEKKKKKKICFNLNQSFNTVILTPEEQWNVLNMRKNTKNYMYSAYKCDLCFKGYGNVTAYHNHMKIHHLDRGQYECDYCHARFSRKLTIKKHVSGHVMQFRCKKCSFIASNRSHAVGHAQFHAGLKHICDICGAIFNQKHTMVFHKRIKHLEQASTEIMCALCGDKFTSKSGMKVHSQRVHGAEKNPKLGPECEECGVHFASDAAWKRHLVMSAKHTVINGCKICGETFPTEQDLKTHIRGHARQMESYAYSNQPVNCSVCGERLQDRSKVLPHMRDNHPESYIRTRRAAGDTPFVCEYCGKCFATSLQLASHKRTHTGERPFKCGECGKSFMQSVSLDLHVLSVHRHVRYTCQTCNRVFKMRATLFKHKKAVHDNIRPHMCVVCNKTFVHPCDLKTHIKHAHDKVPYPKKKKKAVATVTSTKDAQLEGPTVELQNILMQHL